LNIINATLTAPQAVLFDLGGTVAKLLAFDIPKGQQRLFELAHNPRNIPFDVLRHTADPLANSLFGARHDTLFEYPLTSFNRLLYERFGMSFSLPPEQIELEFWKAVVQFRPEPAIQDALELLQRRNIPTGLVSNASFHEHVIRFELARLGLGDAFGFVMSSADYGCRKPHPALFLAAAGRLNLDPYSVWYIGDAPAYDIAGALSVGMGAIWYNPGRIPNDGIVADAELRHWNELPALLDQTRKP
jgi:putative hydrolase of the HAD superfamily